ncbi:hypothetical protein [Luteimonas salinilitoris]|uniref:Lipoprotein n=1 Tax=Luteimonas salinilitoris TaxID=3237697 RepID=A0ABV4HPF2_9GAMM
MMNAVRSFGAASRRRSLLVFAAASLLASACGSQLSAVQSGDGAAMRVVRVDPSEYQGEAGDPLEDACRGWKLTNGQVERFFRLSDRYDDNPYGEFYQVPCSISGEIEADGKTWQFVIGGGATATWHRDGETMEWGCRVTECGPLVLLPYDGMDPG